MDSRPNVFHTKPVSFSLLQMVKSISETAQIKHDIIEDRIFTVLSELLDLTSSHKEYARLAGDLITSTDIVELLVNYTAQKRKGVAHNETEVQVMHKERAREWV